VSWRLELPSREKGAGVEERNWKIKTDPKREAPGRKFQQRVLAAGTSFQRKGRWSGGTELE